MTKIKVKVIEKGSLVKVRSPGKGERGDWRVIGMVANSGPDDPAYDVIGEKHGRRRIFRQSRLIVRRIRRSK